MPPESIRKSLDNSRSPAEEELMQSVEDSIVESAEVIGFNLLLQMAAKMSVGDAIPLLSQSLMEEEKMTLKPTWIVSGVFRNEIAASV
jgi:ferritin-like metal-binding protein YciE